jgi:hypothetical protein
MQSIITTEGMPGATFTMTSTDNPQALTAISILGSGGANPIGILITCETNDVRFILGNATVAPDGLGHVLASGQSIYLASGNAAKTFRFASASAGSAGVLIITPFFEHGKQ